MKLPNGGQAIVDNAKLRDYCLNPRHPVGKYKARVFRSSLGIEASDAGQLQSALLRAARDEEASPTERDEYGARYVVEFQVRINDREATIRSVWIIRAGENIPRLVTCSVR